MNKYLKYKGRYYFYVTKTATKLAIYRVDMRLLALEYYQEIDNVVVGDTYLKTMLTHVLRTKEEVEVVTVEEWGEIINKVIHLLEELK